MSDGYTEIEYGPPTNPVKISNCQTLEFKQEAVHDASGLVHIYDRFMVRVSGYFLAQTEAYVMIQPSMGAMQGATAQTAGSQHLKLRDLLAKPRQHFKMTLGVTGLNPTIILQAKPVTSTDDEFSQEFDCQGGPIPKVLSVEHIAGNAALKVVWEVTVCISADCTNSGSASDTIQRRKGILSNRWTCADDIDENLYLRSRVFVGELKLANPLKNPHDFRELVVPAISPGMRLKSMSFRQSEDQLNLQYTVIHEEVHVTAPHPATSLRISHKVSHAEYAIEIDEVLAITLRGPRDVKKSDLVGLAARIADGKLRTDLLNNKTFRLIRYEMSDESGTSQDSQVTVVYNTKRITEKANPLPDPQDPNGLVGITRRFGLKIDGTMIPDYDNTLTRGNRGNESPDTMGGITVAGAFAAHLQGACTKDFSMNSGIQSKNYPGSSSYDSGLKDSTGYRPTLPEVTVETVPEIQPLPDTTFSESHTKDGIYQTFEIDVQTTERPLYFSAPMSPSSLGLDPFGTSPGSGSPGSGSPGAETAPNDGDSTVFMRLGPSQWERTVRVLAKRHNAPPRLSEPKATFRDSKNNLHVLLSKTEVTCEPHRLPDDTKDYIVRAEYKYGLAKAPTELHFGVPDYDPAVSSGQYGAGPYSFSLTNIYKSDHPMV
jgi:hypothetical protein